MEIILLLVFLALYFLPWLVAASRGRAVGPIFLLNLFLGWTLVGWVVALVWSVTELSPREEAARAAQKA